jgi:hypothetical protein
MRKTTSDLLRQALTVAAASAVVLAASFGGSYGPARRSLANVRVAAPLHVNAISLPTEAICPASIRPWGALSADAADPAAEAISPSCTTAAPSLPSAAEPAAGSRTDLALSP